MSEINKKRIKQEIDRFYTIGDERPNKKLSDKYKNLGDHVYETIRNKIIYHELKPGDRIIDKDLAEELGVSRSLVRQAFTILEKEELITSIPRSGFYVREISKKDVEEIYDIRKLLETHITRCAVPRLSAEDIDELTELFAEAKKGLEREELEKLMAADAKLHRMLINNCGNERLKKMVNTYNDRYVFYRVVDLSRIERAKEAYFDHYKIFEAVKERDVELAAKLMNQHIENAKNIILDNFDEYTYS